MNNSIREVKECELLVKRLRQNATLPVRKRYADAGFDVFAGFPDDFGEINKLQEDKGVWASKELTIDNPKYYIKIPPGCRAAIHTGIAISCPPNVAFQVWPRSGLSLKNGLSVKGGLIDSGYTGEVIIILQNNDREKPFIVTEGLKIAQLVPVMLYATRALQFVERNELPDSDRGEDGFGSSGMK